MPKKCRNLSRDHLYDWQGNLSSFFVEHLDGGLEITFLKAPNIVSTAVRLPMTIMYGIQGDENREMIGGDSESYQNDNGGTQMFS